MKCLQCSKPAETSGDVIDGQPVRVCADGHRTAEATPAMVKQSNKWRAAALKARKNSVIDYAPTQNGEEILSAVNQ